MVDATPPPENVAARIHRRLARDLFSVHVSTCPAFQGMEHLTSDLAAESGILNDNEAMTWV
jgi:hypothetical protein